MGVSRTNLRANLSLRGFLAGVKVMQAAELTNG
jgi:hypothetical protein